MSIQGIESMRPTPPAYTSEFTYVRGRYAVGTERLPYFSIGMQVQDAIRSLALPRDVVLDPKAPIRMEELFQRELDEDRARDEIVPYLKRAHQSKFFNSITVVVLPVEPANHRLLAHEYVDLPDRPPVPTDPNFNVYDVGPVRIKELTANPSIGYISWDFHLARAVIVDGQHRFFAVRELMDDSTFPYRSDLAETALPVLLLVLDEKAGFASSGSAQSSVIATCRALFIDLNKHAVQVKPARQHLLDDRDLTAVSMRQVMSEEVGGTTPPVDFEVQQTGRVPMALVDWSSEDSMFGVGPYVTTNVVLYDIVSAALGILPPDPSDPGAYGDYVDKLVARLELDGRADFPLGSIREEIARADERALPYTLSTDHVRAAADGFRASVGRMVVRPLVELSPYSELIGRYVEAGLLGDRYEQWLGLDPAGKLAFSQETGEDPGETVARSIWSGVKPKYRLAYQVVFQKAFIAALVEMDHDRGDVLKHWGVSSESSRDGFISEWIDRFNTIFTGHLNRNDVWAGAGITANGTIAWSKPSQRAITGFVIYAMLAPLDDWRSQEEANAFALAREWLQDAWQQARPGRPSGGLDRLIKLGAGWKRAVQTYVRTEFRLRDEERSPGEEDLIEHGALQLVEIVHPSTPSTVRTDVRDGESEEE